MRYLTLILLAISLFHITQAQTPGKAKYAIIVTTDGLRWQEVFMGMDSAIARNPKYHQNDSAGICKKYWAPTAEERRGRLMPFLWHTIATKGQVYGNRTYGTQVNNANPYWFSYPGYNEIFSGYVDTAINTNAYPPNPNTNVLEFFNKQKGYKGKVAAFCAWDAFDRILNEERSGFPVVCGYDDCGSSSPDAEQRLLNEIKRDAYDPWDAEAYDVYTHYAAMDHLKKEQPSVMYISYGETDEWAHAGHYKDYLDAAHRVDKWLGDLWEAIQSDPHYKDNTLLFITVDHGRGDKDAWTSHNSKIPGSSEMWFAVMGPQIPAKGDIKSHVQLYQKQFAQTIAHLLGLTFTCEHPVADGFEDILLK